MSKMLKIQMVLGWHVQIFELWVKSRKAEKVALTLPSRDLPA